MACCLLTALSRICDVQEGNKLMICIGRSTVIRIQGPEVWNLVRLRDTQHPGCTSSYQKPERRTTTDVWFELATIHCRMMQENKNK
jgi:hypothetical protein